MYTSNMSCDSFWWTISATSWNSSRGGEGGGEVAAHADRLASLAAEDEGVHRHWKFPWTLRPRRNLAVTEVSMD